MGKSSIKLLSYFYPGWVQKRPFDEWHIVDRGQSSFPGHRQPRCPLRKYYFGDPEIIRWQIETAIGMGVDGFVFCWYWDSGVIYLNEALSDFLTVVRDYPEFSFAIMWANRVPHQTLPISAKDLDGDFYRAFSERIVTTDDADIHMLVDHCWEEYFGHPNYFHIQNRPIFLVFSMRDLFDSLGNPGELTEAYLSNLFGDGIFLTAVAHGEECWLEDAAYLGVDAITSYVLLPDWNNPDLQDYRRYAYRASLKWETMQRISKLPVFPSVTSGWDATCRGKEPLHAGKKTYPWLPVVINDTPAAFGEHLIRGIEFSRNHSLPAVLIASWNEWSEGHYLEPDDHFGMQWLETVKQVKREYLRGEE